MKKLIAIAVLSLAVCLPFHAFADETVAETPAETETAPSEVESETVPTETETVPTETETEQSTDAEQKSDTDTEAEESPVDSEDIKADIQDMLDGFKADMDEKYGEKEWYENVSNFWDKYIGYIVSGVVVLINIFAGLFGLKYGKKNIYKYYAWCKESFIPWMKEDLLPEIEKTMEQTKAFAENADKKYSELLTEITEKYKALEATVEGQEDLKAETQSLIATVNETAKTDRERALQQTKSLKRILSVVASQMAYLSQSTGLNNETADQIRLKYDALIASLDAEIDSESEDV